MPQFNFQYRNRTYLIDVRPTGEAAFALLRTDSLADGLSKEALINVFAANQVNETGNVTVQSYDISVNDVKLESTTNEFSYRLERSEYRDLFTVKRDGVDFAYFLSSKLTLKTRALGFEIFNDANEFFAPIRISAAQQGSDIVITALDFDSARTLQYSIDNGMTWQASGTFTNPGLGTYTCVASYSDGDFKTGELYRSANTVEVQIV